MYGPSQPRSNTSSSQLPTRWNFLQVTKARGKVTTPTASFLQTTTQVGGKIVLYGGCDYYGAAIKQLFVYDTDRFTWGTPNESKTAPEDDPGPRYGHSATLIESHPPKIMLFGGMTGASGTYTFNSPRTTDKSMFGGNHKRGKEADVVEEPDNTVYFLECFGDTWAWNRVLTLGDSQPSPRAEHAAVKIRPNEVAVFGGWVSQPTNELWIFDYSGCRWQRAVTSGIQPRPRYRHTCECVSGKLVVLGGSDNGDDIADGCDYLSIHLLHLDTMEWTHPKLRGENPFPRRGHCSAMAGSHSIAVFGGRRNSEVFFNDLCIIDVMHWTTTFVRTVDLSPIPVSSAGMLVVGNRCFVLAGTDHRGACYNDIRTIDIGNYLDPNDISVIEGGKSDYNFKILVIGDAGVGKSALLVRFAQSLFLDNYLPTIGIDFSSRMIRVEGRIVKLEIWDTAGQERFNTITANYYRGAQGALLVYDVTRIESYNNIRQWKERVLRLGGPEVELLIVGNKLDLVERRQVDLEAGQRLAEELGVDYFVETSALTSENVDQAFLAMAQRIKRKVEEKGLAGISSDDLAVTGKVDLVTRDEAELHNHCCA